MTESKQVSVDDGPQLIRVLIIKTGALGDVIRTTSVLPGLADLYPGLEVCWVTAPAARALIQHHPLIDAVETMATEDGDQLRQLATKLSAGDPWDRVLSLDDEYPMCKLASLLPSHSLSGATLDASGARVYTDDVAPWFDMGLLSRQGKQSADQLKIANQRTHPELFASMLGVDPGRPGLFLTEEVREQARAFAASSGIDAGRPLIGLNTGAGGRWRTKELPVQSSVEMARQIAAGLAGACSFLLLGGSDERSRNQALLDGLRAADPAIRVVDAGNDNGLLEFAAKIELVDLLVSSDSMALHMGIALQRNIVCFFAPTSAAEIELYGQGEKVWSTAPDYCSYLPDADNSSITPERLSAKVMQVLARPD